jgi:Fe-S-cluster containining protein
MARKKVSTGGPRKNRPVARGASHEELSGLELDARRTERLRTVEILRKGRTPLTVIEVADHASTLAEGAVRQAMAKYPPPPAACKEGCDWCCYYVVGASVPEVVRIVEYLRRTLSAQEMDATRERIARADDAKRAMKPAERAGARLPCPLLVNHRCCAYPVRPLTCRGFNSSDAHECELSLQSRSKANVPVYAPQMRLSAFVLDGTRAGLAESGLKGDRVELTAALRIALEVPDAVDRWLAGEAAFAAARLD